MRRRFCGLLAVAFVCVAVPALAADPTGTWKWTTERNGQKTETTLKLKQDGKALTGTISGRNNTETAIEDGKVDGDDVSFTVTREFNGNKFVQKYNGKLSGETIKGKIEFERNGEKQSRDWEAKKS
ncbi:MAG: hypothetical protein JWN86_4739 [Planctomycetota bacterium]|nr:hypothetical protein [Planctomycetota bacterium]